MKLDKDSVFYGAMLGMSIIDFIPSGEAVHVELLVSAVGSVLLRALYEQERQHKKLAHGQRNKRKHIAKRPNQPARHEDTRG